MANNRRKPMDKDAGKTVGSGLGVVPGDTIASALDPYGAAAEATVRENLGNRAEKGSLAEEKQETDIKDEH